MATNPPSILGTFMSPGSASTRTKAGAGSFQRPTFSSSFTFADVERRAKELAHRVSKAVGWNATQSAAYSLVGQQSFTAGVVVGMGENLVQTVVSAVQLLNTLALAEYWESKHDDSFMARVRSSMFNALSPASSLGMDAVSHFWPGFDRKAHDAYEERGAIADAIAHAFSHPKEFFKGLTKAQQAKGEEFVRLLKQQSLSGNFHAGVLMGELLFDLLMLIDLAVGLAKLALAVPRLARFTEDLARLAREFRVARQIETKVADAAAPPGKAFTQAEKDAAAARGRSPAPSAPPKPPVAPPAPPKSYGVAFFGDSNLGYYTRPNATIGRPGKAFFMMPLEDSAAVTDAADAARLTGRAPSAEEAWLKGTDIYGLSFPTDGMSIAQPTAADAAGWPHFLEGGNTAVKLGDGPNAGYLVNSTREFVIPGGNPVPDGSVLFQLGPDGEWIPMKKF